MTSKAFLAAGAISLALLVPCFWQKRIEAGDLRSHVYNAWLVQLISHGTAPGLWIAHPWNNVLFDYLLSGFGAVLGLHAAEKLAVSLSVLVFFWGAFAFVSASTRRKPWFLAPLLAAISYGWTFQEGVFNYYLSIGLAFIGLAILLREGEWPRLLAIVLLPAIVLAHPFGAALLLGGWAWIEITRKTRPACWGLAMAAAIAFLGATHIYLFSRYKAQPPAHSVLFYNGLDQLVFTNRYEILPALIALLIAVVLGIEWSRRGREPEFWTALAFPFGLYVIVETAVVLLPDKIFVSASLPLTNTASRLTSISAVLLCCLAGVAPPRKWHLAVTFGIAMVFFCFLYQDTARIGGMEQRVENLVRALPPNVRILQTVIPPPRYRFSVYHMADRACVGHCFSLGNYEAPSQVFRVRASFGNGIVATNIVDATSMELGTYVVHAQDLPAYQLYQCGPTWADLCVRGLEPGETNGRLDWKVNE